MADPSENKSAEQAIVRHVARDPAMLDDMIRRGVTRGWFSDPLYASTVEAAIRLRVSGAAVDPLSIMSFSTNGVPPERWGELVAIWQDPSPPGEWQTFMAPLHAAKTLRDYDEVMRDAQKYRRDNPRDVDKWLPTVINGLVGCAGNGAYDARPSVHFKDAKLRTVVGKFGLPRFDRFMKGGIWDAALVLIGGVSNHGKSTLAYTLAARCVQQIIRSVFVTTETLPEEVTVGVLRVLTGLSDTEVRNKDPRCNEYLPWLDNNLAIYDYNYASVDMLNRVLSWEDPVVVFYDFLKTPEQTDKTRYVREDSLIAGLGEGLATIGNDHRCTVMGFGQLSAAKSEEFKKRKDMAEVTLFGSARLYHSADQVAIMMRHWDMPNTAFLKCKKDRLPPAYVSDSLYDWEWTMLHSPVTRSFYEETVVDVD